jgi:hypothetical protein
MEGHPYGKGDEVYYSTDGLFYLSKIDGNFDIPGSDDWERVNDSIDNYVLDDQIENAISEGRFIFNENIFSEEEKKMALLYLAAHFLCVDIKNIAGGANAQAVYPEATKSAGNVSVGYKISDTIANNPVLSSLMATGYGQKFLMMISPRLIGNVMLVRGWTTP